MNIYHNFRTDIALARYSPSRKLWDVPIFESKSFVALPTVGALVEGWLLVVPRQCALSFAQLPSGLLAEGISFLDEVAHRVEAEYGPVATFEHGPGAVQSAVGCGVDYAHFHVVPIRDNLHRLAQQLYPQIAWQKEASLLSLSNQCESNHDYWALRQTEFFDGCWIGSTADVPPNQLFRRVLAHSLGLANTSFDWRRDAGEELISATVVKLACAEVAHE